MWLRLQLAGESEINEKNNSIYIFGDVHLRWMNRTECLFFFLGYHFRLLRGQKKLHKKNIFRK